MKTAVLATLIAALVAVQSILLPHVTVWGVMPDIGLIVVCLVGLFGESSKGCCWGLLWGGS